MRLLPHSRVQIYFIAILIAQMIVPATGHLSNRPLSKPIKRAATHRTPSPITPLKPAAQSSNIRLIGPNKEITPVVNEGNTIKLIVTATNGNPINDGITFESGSPD